MGCNTVAPKEQETTAIPLARNSTKGLVNGRSKIQPRCSRAEGGAHLNGVEHHSTTQKGSTAPLTRDNDVRGAVQDVPE